MSSYNRVPGINADNNFPPQVMQALASSSQVAAAIGTQIQDKVSDEVSAAIASDPAIRQAAIDAMKVAYEDLIPMRSSPIVLSQPAGEYTTNSSRASWRIPFTVPCDVKKVKLHIKAQNYRTGDNWGGSTLRGAHIGKHAGNGAMSGPITRIEGSGNEAAGLWIPRVKSQEAVTANWTTVDLKAGEEYILSYEGQWDNAYPMQLIPAKCWGNTSKGVAGNASNSGYSKFSLQPLDMWIEAEAPASVPVYSYFGTSVTMGMSSPESVFGSYPQIHARREGAFAAQTAAGGWAIMDDSAHDPAVIGRFGDAGKSQRAYALWGGSNDINARGATPDQIKAKITSWVDVAAPIIGTSDIRLMTNGAGVRYTGPDDERVIKLEAVNDWIRKDAQALANVGGAIDVQSAMTIQGKPWKSDLAYVIGPDDGHPSPAGHKRYADLLSGTYYPEQQNDGVWYDISSLLDTATYVSGKVYVRRNKNDIEYSISNLQAKANGVMLKWGTLPVEYRPTVAKDIIVYGVNDSTATFTVNTGGGFSLTRSFSYTEYFGSGRLETQAAYPHTRPGIFANWGNNPPIENPNVGGMADSATAAFLAEIGS